MFTSELTTSIDAMEETALKFVLVGDSNVGKSQLSLRFCKDKFYPDSHSTVGIEFATRTLQMHDNAIKAQLWDTAGQERFESMTRAYFRNAVGAILVYDVSKRQSFENMKTNWLEQLREYGHEGMHIIIVGNKCDLDSSRRAVSQVEGAEFAESVGLDFVETSAKSGVNVDIAFRRVIMLVARLLPHIKKSLKLSSLPDGWLEVKSKTKEQIKFQNMWTGDMINERPMESAPTGMIVSSCDTNHDVDVRFRDSSMDLTANSSSEINKATANTDLINLRSEEKEDKADSNHCFCVLL